MLQLPFLSIINKDVQCPLPVRKRQIKSFIATLEIKFQRSWRSAVHLISPECRCNLTNLQASLFLRPVELCGLLGLGRLAAYGAILFFRPSGGRWRALFPGFPSLGVRRGRAAAVWIILRPSYLTPRGGKGGQLARISNQLQAGLGGIYIPRIFSKHRPATQSRPPDQWSRK